MQEEDLAKIGANITQRNPMSTPPNPNLITIERCSSSEYKIGYQRFDSGLGEYQYTIFLGSCAQTIIFLTRLLFEAEANDDLKDKRDESAAIGAMVLTDMKENPSKFLPPKAKTDV